MDIGIFDHYEEDGQLSFLGFGDGEEGPWMPGEAGAYMDLEDAGWEGTSQEEDSGEKVSGKVPGERIPTDETSGREAFGDGRIAISESARQGITVCACCGKMLLVTEKEGRYVSACSKCGVTYAQ